ncbi:MAG: hypothetical protein HFI76_14735 [Lachnospiraceae bacterium]|jgi:hypothetical protein|nr:hypothetical protein [Lachnospiraceae bacterium]
MKKDKYASLNTTRKRGNTLVIVIAITALCIAGVLGAIKLHAESSTVFLDTGTVNMTAE